MSGVTGPIRVGGWNVRLTVGDLFAPKQFAGVYQHPGEHEYGLTFADVCAELALCFELPGGQGQGQSQSQSQRQGQHPDASNDVNSWTGVAFALTEAPSDHEPNDPPAGYPTFVTRDRLNTNLPGVASPDTRRPRTVTYHIVRHKPCELPAESSLNDHLQAQCAQFILRDPDRRHHPFFFPCGTKPAASKFDIMPLRSKAKGRSQSPPKRSATTSGAASPNKPDDDAAADGNMCNDMVAPAALNIDPDAAKKKEGEFRMACLAQATRCAVSGEGEPWSLAQLVGPGVEACHIVPQAHYYTYPFETEADAAAPGMQGQGAGDDDDADAAAMRHRVRAWYETWSSHNGILLMRHLHLLFDCRLFAIHPVTLRIRAFAPYHAVTRYHGQKAQVTSIVDRKALRHHYDLCCIENMAALRPMQELPPPATTSGRGTPAARAVTPGAGGTMPISGLTSLPMTPPTQPMASLPSGDPSKRPRPSNSDHDGGTGDDDDGGDFDDSNNYHDSDSYDNSGDSTDSQKLLCSPPSCGYCQNCLECITRITRAVGSLKRKMDWCQDCQECECDGLGGCEWCDLCGCRINDPEFYERQEQVYLYEYDYYEQPAKRRKQNTSYITSHNSRQFLADVNQELRRANE